jgi:chitodextrinase
MLNNLRKRETWLALLLMVVMLLSGIPCGAPVALAEDAAGGPGQVMSAVDSSPPAWPDAQLDVSNLTAESLTLTWSAATDDTGVTGYTVYQNGSPLASVTDGTSYGVANLGAGTTYTFSIQAFDAAGNQSSDGPSRVETTLTAENLEEENPGKEGGEEIPGGSGEGTPAGTGGLQVPGFLAGRQQAESATLVSAVSDHLGKKITLTFSKVMADPAGKQAQFTVAPNETAGTVRKAQLGSDPTQIVLSLSGYLGVGAAQVSYTAGDVQAADGTALISFNDQAVVNNTLTVSPRMVNFDGAATEIAYNTSDPSNPVLQYRYDDPADYDNVNLAWYLSSGFFTPMVDDIVNYVSFYEKDTGAVINLPNLLSRPNAPATYIDGRTINQQIVTDWTFWQISGAAPLGLNLVSQALKPSTTYVVELKQGFTFNNNATLPLTYQFEFTTTATSAGNPYWETGSELSASDVGDNGLTLNWPPASDNHGAAYENAYSGQYIPNLRYSIYQDGILLTTVSGSATSYDVTGLAAGTTYQFKVEAVDFANNRSATDLEAWVTTAGAALFIPPAFSADSTDNTAGKAIDLTFSADAAWQAAITGITVNGASIAGQYSVSDGVITISGDVFATGGDYIIVVKATAYSDASVTQTIASDTAAPVWTSGELTASYITSHSLTLTWAGAGDNTAVTGYKVYQGDTLLDTLGDVSAYSVTGLAADTQYTFTVQAGDAAGNWSTDGPSTTVTTSHSGGGGSNDTQAPTWPDNAAVTVGRTQTEATLTWPAAMDNKGVAGYRIKRDGTVISSVGGSITTYTDTGLERGNNTYVWSVEAFDESGNYSKAITGQSVPGQNPLSFIAAKSSLTTVNGSNSTNDGPIEGSTTVPVRPTIRLYFDRGVTTDAVWSCNSQCFTMQTGTGTNVPIDVFRLGSTDTINDNLRYIFISPKSALTSGESYKIIISKNLTANNGHTLGENNGNKDEEVTFTVAVSSGSSGGGGVSVTTSGPTSTTGSASVEPAVGATVGLGDMVRLVIPAHALQETGPVTVEIKKVASPPAIPTGFKVAGEVYEFSVGGQTVYSFAQSVALTFQFDASQIGADEVPAVYYYDESQSRWVNIGGTVSGSTITVQVDHFTKYAVFSVKKPATPVVTPTPGTLNDISEHWALNNIEKLVALGVVSGYPDGSFRLDNTITRAEFATVLVKAFGLSPQSGEVFADTKGHWAEDFIATAAANGLVSGYDADTFGPDDLITREQIAVMMVKAAGLTMISEETTFADSSAISEWAKDSVATVFKSGLMKGYPDNSFQPLGNATRAEALTVLANSL